jgi:hypothetical protein
VLRSSCTPTDGKEASISHHEQPGPVICIVAAEHADVLLTPLREHFATEPLVDVLVERRTPDGDLQPAVRGHARAPVAERDPVRALPPELRPEARHLRLVQRLAPLRRTHEDTATAELVAKALAAEPEAVSELWWRIAERAHDRLRFRLGKHAAEGATNYVLGRILDELPRYEPELEPLSYWLDRVVDRYADERAAR